MAFLPGLQRTRCAQAFARRCPAIFPRSNSSPRCKQWPADFWGCPPPMPTKDSRQGSRPPPHANEGLPAGSAPTRALDELAESLTRRELEVLQMLAAGLSNKEIAARLSISEHTVKFHVASILGKLGAGSRTEAVSLGIRRGLVLL